MANTGEKMNSDTSLARDYHANCMVCSQQGNTPRSLRLCFTQDGAGGVSAPFTATTDQQGYTGLLHGGQTSTLLDAAMTHCLFAQGITALTAELTVRFIAPVPLGKALLISAQLLGQRRGIYQLEAQLTMGNERLARATGKFIVPPEGVLRHGN